MPMSHLLRSSSPETLELNTQPTTPALQQTPEPGETVHGTVLSCRLSSSWCHLTVAPFGGSAPVQVRIGMTERVPVGATVVLNGCATARGRVLAAGLRQMGPVATAQSREQAQLRRWLFS